MKPQIDLKYGSCGPASGVGTSLNEAGRYKVFTAEGVSLVLDTQTGKVWAKGWSSISEFKKSVDSSNPQLSEPR